MGETTKEKECCPKFDSELRDHKTHVWNEKTFIKDYIPLVSGHTFASHDGQGYRAQRNMGIII